VRRETGRGRRRSRRRRRKIMARLYSMIQNEKENAQFTVEGCGGCK